MNLGKSTIIAIAKARFFAGALLLAQAGTAQPASQAPAAQLATPAAVPATQTSPSGHPNNAYWQEHDRQLLFDFGGLAHFKDADMRLAAPAPGENRVVFLGDSITQGWNLDQSFPGKPYINRGISGQTTPQMLVRFRQDVIDLQPKVVVILGGTNDIAGNTGPMTSSRLRKTSRPWPTWPRQMGFAWRFAPRFRHSTTRGRRD